MHQWKQCINSMLTCPVPRLKYIQWYNTGPRVNTQFTVVIQLEIVHQTHCLGVISGSTGILVLTETALYFSSPPSITSSTSDVRSREMFDANTCWDKPRYITNIIDHWIVEIFVGIYNKYNRLLNSREICKKCYLMITIKWNKQIS